MAIQPQEGLKASWAEGLPATYKDVYKDILYIYTYIYGKMFAKIYVKMYTKLRLRHQSLGHRPDRVQENMSRPHHPKKLNSNYHGPYIKVPVKDRKPARSLCGSRRNAPVLGAKRRVPEEARAW